MDNQETKKIKTINPYYKQSFNITLLNSLLDEKYCVHKLLSKNTQQYSHTYLALNIHNKEQFIVKFYKLNEIEDFHQMQLLRYTVLKRAEIFFNLNSSYVVKCYQVYQNQCYLAIVYEYFQRQSLQTQLMNKRIARCDFAIILKHMLMAVLAVHRTGLFAKKLDLSKIYFKNGHYKLTQFDIFWSEHNQNDVEICPELRHSKQQHIEEQIGPRCDLWALALFELKLLLGPQYRKEVLTLNDSMTIFTKQLQNQIQFDLVNFQNIKQFLKQGLMINQQDRTGWPSLFKLLNLDTQIKKGNYLNNNEQIPISQPSYIGQSQDYDRTPSSKRRPTTLTRTFYVNTTENIIFQQQQISICKAYFDEQKQLQINSNSYLINSEKQNPFYLSLFINKLRYVPLVEQDIEIFLQKLKHKQKNLYQEIESFYFQAQKSQYILKNLIRPIQTDNLLNLENKRNIQFMYLLCSRIFTNLSYVNIYLKQKKSMNEQEQKIIKEYQKLIASTYEQAKNKFVFYSGMLTSSQNKIGCMFRDRCKKFANKQEKEEEDRYLTGIEEVDYKKKDQIYYTYNKYMEKIKRELEKSENKNIKILLNICDKYRQIMTLVDSCEIRGKQFKQCVQQLLNKDFNKNNMYGENKYLSLSYNQNDKNDEFLGRGEKIVDLFKKKSSI